MKRIITSIACGMLLCFGGEAKVVKDFASSSDNVLTFRVDSIDYRQDLTRVYGAVKGRPHTSNRIDDVKYVGAGGTLETTDIDGVDYKRYFQWEEDGEIPVEIDFPATKPSSQVQFLFTTVHGQSTTTAKQTAHKRK
ncbi:MAG: hypothetical protein NC212_09510 [Staphylococcus sp.]|nr:hypothetical protein [Staphylococcus sp.]